MDSNIKPYNYLSSFARIDEILATPAGSFEEAGSLPDRDLLTYTNGFYSYCAAIFVDIRESSKLPDKYDRPILAKLYRAFISEMVALFNSHSRTREVNIVGDCVWGVYNTPSVDDINELFSIAAEGRSLQLVLNYKLQQAGYNTPLRLGFGLSYGRALMIKAGYKGSGINEVVYMGDVVNQAAKLASIAGKGFASKPLYVDSVFYSNLSDENKPLLRNAGIYPTVYCGDVVNLAMQDWYNENCK